MFDDADTVQEGTLFSIIGRKGVEGRQSILKEKVRCAGLTFDPSLLPTLSGHVREATL